MKLNSSAGGMRTIRKDNVRIDGICKILVNYVRSLHFVNYLTLYAFTRISQKCGSVIHA